MRASAQTGAHAAGTIGVLLEVPGPVIAEPGFETQENAAMNTQAKQVLHLPKLAGGIAAILVSGIAIASLAISVQGTDGFVAPAEPPEAVTGRSIAAPPARLHRCAECGVIESTREINASDKKAGVDASGPNAAQNAAPNAAGVEILQTPARNYEITIRLNDGSMRVITDVNPADWRQGERVTLIAGVE